MSSIDIYTSIDYIIESQLHDVLRSSFIPTRLYIKRIRTPQKVIWYFGKYTRNNIMSYTGSGVKWKNIVKHYGKDSIETVWVSDWYTNPEEIFKVAISFSIENSIVESDMWANLIPETGIDAAGTIKSKRHCCPCCNKEFYAKPSANRKFCSISCQAKQATPNRKEHRNRMFEKYNIADNHWSKLGYKHPLQGIGHTNESKEKNEYFQH